MFKRREGQAGKRARCSSWVLGAMKSRAASVGGWALIVQDSCLLNHARKVRDRLFVEGRWLGLSRLLDLRQAPRAGSLPSLLKEPDILNVRFRHSISDTTLSGSSPCQRSHDPVKAPVILKGQRKLNVGWNVGFQKTIQILLYNQQVNGLIGGRGAFFAAAAMAPRPARQTTPSATVLITWASP
jgi:hypothetical protein